MRSRAGRLRFSLLTMLVVVAALAGVLGWMYRPRSYTAQTLVETVRWPRLIFDETHLPDEAFFAQQKQAFAVLLTSEPILDSALMRSDVAALEIVKGCAARGRDVAREWLKNSLEVSYPDGLDVMKVSIRGANEDMREECILLNAVVDVFVTNVQTGARLNASERESNIQLALTDLKARLIKQLTELQELEVRTDSPFADSFEDMKMLELDIGAAKTIYQALTIRLLQLQTARRLDETVLPHAMDAGFPVRVIQTAVVDEH